MKLILGTKKEMTQFFDEAGKIYPATLVSIQGGELSDFPAGAIIKVLDDQQLAASLKRRGRAQAKKYAVINSGRPHSDFAHY